MARPLVIRPRRGWANQRALRFDGATSYGTIPLSGLPTAACTVSCWVRVDQELSFATSNAFIVGDIATDYVSFGKGGSSQRFAIRYRMTSAGLISVFPAGDMVVGDWYHFYFSFDGTTAIGKINDVLAFSTNRAGDTMSLGTSTILRLARTVGTIYSPITMDELSIWDVAVPVSTLASSNLPINILGGSGLVRYYRMGELYTPGAFEIPCQAGSGHPITWINGNENTQFVAGAA